MPPKQATSGSPTILPVVHCRSAVAYDHRDAEGFIKLYALRLRTLGQRKKKLGL